MANRLDELDDKQTNKLFDQSQLVQSEFSEDKAINILLLGETGVGKSTFINAFANYLTYNTLEDAKQDDILSLIPSSFTLTDQNFEEREVFVGKDANEKNNPGQSCTQKCKCYVFPLKESNVFIRLIDTPGVGDTRGLDFDKLNFDNILASIGKYSELHCICILLKPNNSRITVSFEFCFKQLLCHLEKSANKNIVFLFTNARGTFYQPGDTVRPLKELLSRVHSTHPFVDIQFKKETVFCFDNEAFRFLVALKNGVQFSENEMASFSNSWITSVNECIRLMNYIIGTDDQKGLTPHLVKNTLSVNEARRQIVSLTQPLADIVQNIEDNLTVMGRHSDDIRANVSNIEELKKKLYIPYVDIEMTEIPHPKTVCSNPGCCRTYEVHGLSKREYTQVCHAKCDLGDQVTKDTIGDPGLIHCVAMDHKGNCKECGCGYQKHLHIYYESKAVSKQQENDSVKDMIKDKETAKKMAENKIKEIEKLCQDNRKEVNEITKITAKFAHFLKHNAIAPYNDSFKNYMEHLIENEKIYLSKGVNNSDKMSGLQNMLAGYEQEKAILDQALNDNRTESFVSASEVLTLIEELYKLPINGKKIKLSQDIQARAINSEQHNPDREVHFKPKNSSRSFGFKKFGVKD